jgi:LacI family transcriptional regulator
VPDDIAVGGFDDIAISQYLSPPLSTVRVDAYTLGERAVLQILPFTRTRKPVIAHHEVVPTQLVLRRSCGSMQPMAPDSALRPRRRPASESVND